MVEDAPLDDGKRWVLVSRNYRAQKRLLLARAADSAQQAAIGDQTGGRVFQFLRTEDFDADYERFTAADVLFLEVPRDKAYGKVAIFKDPIGNK